MVPQFVLESILVVAVLGGLAFGDAVADRLASLGDESDLVSPDELD